MTLARNGTGIALSVFPTRFHLHWSLKMSKRFFLKATAMLALVTTMGAVHAQTTPIKFQLDWRFEGPAALFLAPVAKG